MRFNFSYYLLIFKILKRNKLRSFLTSLGIIIGIASIIIIMSVGAGAHSLIVNEINTVGSNLIGVLPGATDDSGIPAAVMGVSVTTLTVDDGLAIEEQVAQIEVVAAYLKGVATISWQNKVVDTTLTGITSNYLEVESANIKEGQFISEEYEGTTARVVVLGSQVAEDLFFGVDPVNEKVKINKEIFRVIGILESRGSSGLQNQDNQIFVPLSTAQKLIMGVNHVSLLRGKVVEGADLNYTIQEVETVVRERHNIDDPEKDDFTVKSSEQALDTLADITGILNYFLAMVAAISLLVGGIGIMNIMLVSVHESVKEIGLRKAVGATAGDIVLHFLIQTIILALIGGIVGIIAGAFVSWLISLVANYLGYNWDFIISPSSVILATFFIISVGVFFGWYPSKQASALQPVDALRYE